MLQYDEAGGLPLPEGTFIKTRGNRWKLIKVLREHQLDVGSSRQLNEINWESGGARVACDLFTYEKSKVGEIEFLTQDSDWYGSIEICIALDPRPDTLVICRQLQAILKDAGFPL